MGGGETGRFLHDRLKEHKRAIQNLHSSSELASHMLTTDHRVNVEGAEQVCTETFYNKRIFKEARYTKVFGSSNRVFHNLDTTWNAVL